MKIYKVGGAVRDHLLNYPSTETDWVVVGATPQDLLDQGFRQVGKDFPVFLHPTTNDEYALARTERKQGHGYHGFAIHASPDVTLEEDLIRRDLTINAMAMDNSGELIDPYGGQRDLADKVLRHISPAFREDPLRVLRVARFAARYHHLGFQVHPDTLALMRHIGDKGELEHLVSERVFIELKRALAEPNPEVFITILRQCGALKVLLPEVDALFGIPQRAAYHPEIDTGIHTLMCLQQAVKLDANDATRFAVLCHDLGKALTPADILPRHIGHEQRGLAPVTAVCKRLGVPNTWQQLALLVCEQHLNAHRAFELRGKTLLKLITRANGLRQSELLLNFITACEADARGRKNFEHRDYPQADYLREALHLAQSVTINDVGHLNLHGKAIGEALTKQRIKRLDTLRKQQKYTA